MSEWDNVRWDRTAGFGEQFAWVLISVVVSGVVWLPLAYLRSGRVGLASAFTAAAVCLAAGAMALLIGGFFHRAGHIVGGALLGMGLRLALPLSAIVFVRLADPQRAAAGMVYDILFFYFVILVAETWLAVRQALDTGRPQGGTD
jgi:hypothetical protein